MFNDNLKKNLNEQKARADALAGCDIAIRRNIATIEFTPDGHILTANPLFLDVVGYPLEAIVGKHHRMFCEPGYANSSEYREFWAALGNGTSQRGTFLRTDRNGRHVWLEATYFAVLENGQVTRVIKFASDATVKTRQHKEHKALIQALDRSQAIIEFTPDGEVLTANANFLESMGYSLGEVVGKHHRMFCSEEFYRENPDFWKKLKAGQYRKGQFQRHNRKGETVWLEATYNPIFDEAGNVLKVVKFASDITASARQRQAVLETSELAHRISSETSAIWEAGAGLLQNAVDNASLISEQVQGAAELIELLKHQSKAISDIVNTIRSIAEQTNLLALNAAIEAARAGEHGRGFAVVADEVRHLASRTSTSTLEIEEVVKKNSSLTSGVLNKMDVVSSESRKGNELINEAASVFNEIKLSASKVTHAISELSRLK